MYAIRHKWITKPILKWFQQSLPTLSVTEQQALDAGSAWWESGLFAGRPDFKALQHFPAPQLSGEEQEFIQHQLATLLGMLNDYEVVKHQRDLPQPVWDYLKANGFFALNIAKKYGGLQFSALANSTIVGRIATRSLSAAVTVMVPNSLGPGELLQHYGTKEQQDYWLPRLAKGADIPCFALTSPQAGSDAGSLSDSGIVCYGEHNDASVLGVRLSWNKRYITLAPVATVIGLAFKLDDPQHLLGEKTHLGITCALIPATHPGVQIGDRHDPLGLAFMNGPTSARDVFIPMDWLIGGAEYAGQGWRMLMECLSVGRGISLPALGCAIGHMACRTTSAYACVRHQFSVPIGEFEGIAQIMARMGGLTYLLEATRTLTTTALDLHEKPAVVTAIAKYHMTEMARTVLNDAMDIHAGRGIQLGPMNYLAAHYQGMPVAITVEGANILTRSLMIFGQGAMRCHPYLLAEITAASRPGEQNIEEFERLFIRHVRYSLGNAFGALAAAVTGSYLLKSPVRGPLARYYRAITRLSRALAIATDVTLLILGGELKRREMISARLGDVLSYLYMASGALKRFESDGRPQEDLDFVHYAVRHSLYKAANALSEVLRNYPHFWAGRLLKWLIFPLGQRFNKPDDKLCLRISKAMMTPGAQRERLTHLCHIAKDGDDNMALVERAFLAAYQIKPLIRKVQRATQQGTLPRLSSLTDSVRLAQKKEVLTEAEAEAILKAEKLRTQAIQVDHFSHDFAQILTSIFE